jgi:hypothetical protein
VENSITREDGGVGLVEWLRVYIEKTRRMRRMRRMHRISDLKVFCFLFTWTTSQL